MTKQGSFKRAVRQRAQATGLRYTEARAALEKGRTSPFARTRPVELAALRAHLETRYGIRVTSIAPIDDDPETRPRGSWAGHYPWTLVVKREDGSPWVARVFSSPADTVGRVEGDAEILRFLASHDFPAERLAHDDPVSVLDGERRDRDRVRRGRTPDQSPVAPRCITNWRACSAACTRFPRPAARSRGMEDRRSTTAASSRDDRSRISRRR